ncbi:MAG: DedA family protein [SAR324 cluster bacterium]|nr:DedA family protein [SAR324 cluster bacterium]
MDWSYDQILVWFSQYAYDPTTLYLTVVGLLLLSSFGLPIPEEVSLLGAGLVIYMGLHPELFPPPSVDAVRVKAIPTAAVCFFAVFLSDFLVFLMGKYFGTQVLESRWFGRFMKPKKWEKIEKWTEQYGMWACALFRFTPGIRFPGHLMCGSLDIKVWKFVVADGAAALLTVPTQIILVAWYGDAIFTYLKQFKVVLGIIIGVAVLMFLGKKLIAWRKSKNIPDSSQHGES